jgi:peptidoglycan/xylan/chitin deacetylase (PgdA/CDA1 family)
MAGTAALAGSIASTRREYRNTLAVGFGTAAVLYPGGVAVAALMHLWLRSLGARRLAALGSAACLAVLAAGFRKPDSVALFALVWAFAMAVQFGLSVPSRAGRVARVVLAAILVVTLAGFYYLNRYVYHGLGLHVDVVRAGSSDFRVVALTFDDGPTPYTSAILDILRDRNVPATFFVVGRQVELFPELARRIVEEGHLIGNHTYTHRNLLGLPAAAVYAEIVRAEEAIVRITGVQPRYLRPPRGLYSRAVLDLAERRGYTLVLWSRSSHDWAEVSVADVAANIVRSCRPGDILLFHDGGDLFRASGGSRRNTVLALPQIIDALRARGYHFVTVRELLILRGLTEDQ